MSEPSHAKLQNLLPIVQIPVSLCALCAEVDDVAAEEEVVLRCDGHGISHEGRTVTNQGKCHRSGDATTDQPATTKIELAYISGSFCVSMTAAMGIPKLEAGPQKSAHVSRLFNRAV